MKIRYYLILLLCLLFPVILIYILSQYEIRRNQGSVDIHLEQMAYGNAMPIMYGDINEIIQVQGKVDANQFSKITVEPSLTDVAYELELGVEYLLDEPILANEDSVVSSPVNGILTTIKEDVEEQVVLEFLDLGRLSINLFFDQEVRLDPAVVYQVQIKDQTYELENAKASHVHHQEGYLVHFDFVGKTPALLYQEEIEGLFFSGRADISVLIAPLNSVYRSSVSGSPAVRIVSQYGQFIEERPVRVGLQDLDHISIVGVEEGLFVDAGAALVYGGLSSNQGE